MLTDRQKVLIDRTEKRRQYFKDRAARIKRETDAAIAAKAELEKREIMCAEFVKAFPQCEGFGIDDLWEWANEIDENGNSWADRYLDKPESVAALAPVAEKPRKLTARERKAEEARAQEENDLQVIEWFRGVYERANLSNRDPAVIAKRAASLKQSHLITGMTAFYKWARHPDNKVPLSLSIDGVSEYRAFASDVMAGNVNGHIDPVDSIVYWAELEKANAPILQKRAEQSTMSFDELNAIDNAALEVIEP